MRGAPLLATLLILASLASPAAARPRAQGRPASAVASGPVVDFEAIPSQQVATRELTRRKRRLPKLELIPDPNVTIKDGQISFGISVGIRSGKSGEAYVARSLTAAATDLLTWELSGDEVEQRVRAEGPDTRVTLDQARHARFTIPAGRRVRFVRTVGAPMYAWSGAPWAILSWRIFLNGEPRTGELRITLPAR